MRGPTAQTSFMDTKSKTNRPAAKLPRGFADRGPDDIRAVEEMMRTIRGVYERYGFEPVETPFVEYTDALGKFLPDQDRPNEGVFSFQDDDGEWLSLRYDLTAPLARYVAQNYDSLPKPYRSYRAGWVFRNEKPGPGRFRQFMQFDADTVGAASVAADAEMCMMAADALEALGIPRGDYLIKVNSRKVLDGVMEAIGLGGEQHAGTRLRVLRAIDKLDRLGIDGVEALLGPKGRTDESGDYTPGAGLDQKQINHIRRLVVRPPQRRSDHIHTDSEQEASALLRQSDVKLVTRFPGGETSVTRTSNAATVSSLRHDFKDNDLYQAGLKELEQLAAICAAAEYDEARVVIDPSVVRGLEYYTGPVFEAELTFQVPNEKGEPVVFGSVGGGGRYDGLVGRFRGEDVPATGFSIGVSRLAAALRLTGRLADGAGSGPVVVTVMERDRLADYQRMVSALRNAGIAAELYLGQSGMKAQLKYADRRNSPCVVIQGSNEREAGKVQIKDLAAGKEQAGTIADHQTWREERPGQFEADEGQLVEAVRSVLARRDKV
jgi:histidyl-tRNA synthetase